MIKTSAAYQAAIVGNPRRIDLLAVVDISDPDMAYGAVTASGFAPWSVPAQLHDKIFDAPPRCITLETNRWLLDGTFSAFPDDFQVQTPIGVATDAMSGADGTFSTPVWVQESFSQVQILQACGIFFSSDPLDGVPEDFKVEIFSNGTAYYTKEFTGNTETEISLSGFTVQYPDAIRVTCTKWSLPHRRMRMVEILPGVIERWDARMLATFTVQQQGDVSCMSLPFGSATLSMDNLNRRFEPRAKNGLFQSIEERQGVDIYIGVRLPSGAVERCKVGVYYQSGDGWKTGNNDLTMQWYLVDIIGLLSDRTYLPPETLPTTLSGWIASLAAQLGENFTGRWHVDPDYADLPVTATAAVDVTDKKCGDILRWACQVTGTWPRADSETGYLTAEPLWSQGNQLTLDNLVNYPTMKANEQLAALIFKLADGNDTEYVISGNSTSSDKTVTVQNPFIHTKDQALAVARTVLSCYGGNLLETTGRGDPSSEIGDVDTIWLDESQATTARRTMQNFQIQDGVLQGCQTKLLQADGSYLFQERAVLTEDGTWTAPANVKGNQLRLIVAGGGDGGTSGTDGTWQEAGEDGVTGQGGFIWIGTIDINPQQTFAVHIGQGGGLGEAGGVTTFGPISSANGKRFTPSCTDIASGDAYGRTGVKSPLPHSADGGIAGKGGVQGHREWKTKKDADGNSVTYLAIINRPGKGTAGAPGGSGVVVVYWDKEDETA